MLFVLVFVIYVIVLVRHYYWVINIGSFVDERDGQKYRTVKIGKQVWMAQNLNYKTDNSWCYDDDESNGKKYGRLYTWDAAKVVCPKGWHLPTRSEWDDMISAIGGSDNGGKKLKAEKWWCEWDDGLDFRPGNGKNRCGFSALPGGAREVDGSFVKVGYRGYWWTATEKSDRVAYGRRMFNECINVTDDEVFKSYGLSVRCVRNDN